MNEANILSVVSLEDWEEEEREPGRLIMSIRPAGLGFRITVSPDEGIHHVRTDHGAKERKCAKFLMNLCDVLSIDTDFPGHTARYFEDAANTRGATTLVSERTRAAMAKMGRKNE